MTSSDPNRERPAFCLALEGSPNRTIFGNLSSFICRTCPNHLNLSLIIALESGIEPHFSYNLLFKTLSVSLMPRTIQNNFSGKHLANLHLLFGVPIFRAIFDHYHQYFLWKTPRKSSSSSECPCF